MHGYEQDLDDEVGYDDYYSGDEDEYEEEEEEPPKEELEFLQLRQKLKDSKRKNDGKPTSIAQSSQERKRKLPYNNFGSFFGPSRPVIASRVIQESKSFLENEIRTAKTPNSNQTMRRPVPTSSSAPKNVEKRPRVVSEARRKVEALKDTRDYSFLLSDDADLPLPKKEPLSRSGSFRNSESRSAQLSARPKQSSGINGRTAHGPPREEKRPVSANGHPRPASSGSQMNHSRPVSSGGSHMQSSRPAPSGSQMQPRSVSGRPAPPSSQRPAPSGSQRPAPSGKRPSSLTNRQAPVRPGGSMTNGQSANRNGQPHSRADYQRPAPAKVPVDHRRQMSSSNGRPASMSRPVPSRAPLERRPAISAGKSSLQSGQRPSSSRPMSSDPRQRGLEQRKVSRDPTTSRMIPKQSAAPSSKHQMMSKPGLKRPAPRDVDGERRVLKKKRPMSEDDQALLMIRKMFRTDRYAGCDDDDRNMEANFEDIQKEERRSARIARQEDEEQERLLAEEERRARLKKSQKLSR